MSDDIEICKCTCHGAFGPRTIHNFPCCKTCDYCKKNIRYHYYDEHLDICKKKFEDMDTQFINLDDLILDDDNKTSP